MHRSTAVLAAPLLALALPVLALLSGCATSPKTDYFALSVAKPADGPALSVASPVQVAAVHIPPSLDRRQMVRYTQANAVRVSGRDRWSAPLGEMTRQVLSQDLAERLPKGSVILPDAPAPSGTAQIVVTLDRFGADAAGRVALGGSWTLLEGTPPKPVLERDVRINGAQVQGSDADAVAGEMSRLLGELATRMASTIAERG